MDDTLPSYGEATTRDHWSIIASFVRSADLCSAALVCRKWNAIFSPLVWGNPASHFGKENDAVYVALVRFKRTLLWARAATREQTHTLHLPPAQAEIYHGPRPVWLSEILHRLPRLQSLVVSHLPFFDHRALSSLIAFSQPNGTLSPTPTTYNLRLLDASYCNNLTPQALAGALRLFPALIYLDLSGTASSRYPEVLSSLAYIPALKILKLQRLFLHDEDLAVLIKAVGRSLRNLDLRWNRITDRGIVELVQDCIPQNTDEIPGSNPHLTNTKIQQILNSHVQDVFVRNKLTQGFALDLGIESTGGNGITHLYVSNNLVTVDAAMSLLQCSELRVLDLGDVITTTVATAQTSSQHELSPADLVAAHAEALAVAVEDYAENLTYLRIHHTIVTHMISHTDAKGFEMDGTSSISVPGGQAELEGVEHTSYEMPDDGRAELPGSIPAFAELEGSPVPCPSPSEHISTPEIQISRRDSTDSPCSEPLSALSPTLDSSGGLFSPISPLTPFLPKPIHGHLAIPRSTDNHLSTASGLELDHRAYDTNLPQVVQPHRRTYSGVLDDHESRLRFRRSQAHVLLPGTLGHIRTLVLTNVPSKSSTADASEHLVDFIKGCAEEEQWAYLRASVGYQLPPGPDRWSAERHYARTLFPLQKLVLEMEPEPQQRKNSGGWIRPSNHLQLLSSTLDPDCETYLKAAKSDFSFFDSAECGQPDTEGLAPIPASLFREKFTISADASQEATELPGPAMPVQPPVYDVLAPVSKFRKARKAEHEAVVATGGSAHSHIDGYWSGTIEVVRPGR